MIDLAHYTLSIDLSGELGGPLIVCPIGTQFPRGV